MFDTLRYYATKEVYDPAYVLLYSEINLICIIMLTILFVRAKGELQSEALCRRTKQAIFWCFMLIVTDLMWFLMSQGMLLGGMPELTGLKSIYP